MRINRELGRTPERLYMRAAAVAFWLIVWELGARALGQDILLTPPLRVLNILFGLMRERGFYMALVSSTLRISAGFALALVIGTVLGVAAEVIGLPPGSIGERLYDAKIYLNTGEVLAWTLVIVLISLACEKLIPGAKRDEAG